MAGGEAGDELLVLPALVLVQAVVDRAEDVRFVVARGVHRDEAGRRRPGGEGGGRVAAGTLDGPFLRLREEDRVEGGGVEALQLRVHRDDVLRIEQDGQRLHLGPALLEGLVGGAALGVVAGVADGVERGVDLRVVDVVVVLAARRHQPAVEQRVRRRLDGVVVVALEVAVPAALGMRLALPARAPRGDDGEGHEGGDDVDADARHLLRRQRAPDHPRRLVVRDHHVELEEGRRGAGGAGGGGDGRRGGGLHQGAAFRHAGSPQLKKRAGRNAASAGSGRPVMISAAASLPSRGERVMPLCVTAT